MGQPKLLLPLAGKTVLQHVIDAVRGAGVETVIVVIGPGQSDLAALAEQAGAAVLELENDTPEMRDTIERGLDWLQTHCQPAPDDGWLLLPADHPCIEMDVVLKLLQARESGAGPSIIVPTYQGQRGHPTWLAWEHVAGIRALPRGLGLNAYLRKQGISHS